jgi:hypothetical protein
MIFLYNYMQVMKLFVPRRRSSAWLLFLGSTVDQEILGVAPVLCVRRCGPCQPRPFSYTGSSAVEVPTRALPLDCILRGHPTAAPSWFSGRWSIKGLPVCHWLRLRVDDQQQRDWNADVFSEDVNCYCLLLDAVVVACFLSEHE